MILTGFAYRTFRRIVRRLEKRMEWFRVIYERSGLDEPFPVYLSAILLYTIFSFIIVFAITTTLEIVIFHVRLIRSLISSFMLSAILATIVYAMFMIYPAYRSSSRKYVIDAELIHTIGDMSVLAATGIPLYRVIEELAKVEENKDIKTELMKLLKSMQIEGEDISKALLRASEESPSEKLRSLWEGMRNTILTSGDLWQYLYHMHKNLVSDKIANIKQVASTLNVLSEAYAGIMILLPLTLVITLTMMSAMGGYVLGISPLALLVILLLLIVPAAGIISYLLVDAILSKI